MGGGLLKLNLIVLRLSCLKVILLRVCLTSYMYYVGQHSFEKISWLLKPAVQSKASYKNSISMFLYCALFTYLIGSSIFVFENAKENVLPTIKIIFNMSSIFVFENHNHNQQCFQHMTVRRVRFLKPAIGCVCSTIYFYFRYLRSL